MFPSHDHTPLSNFDLINVATNTDTIITERADSITTTSFTPRLITINGIEFQYNEVSYNYEYIQPENSEIIERNLSISSSFEIISSTWDYLP